VPHNNEALMDFGLVILPPFASQRAGDLFWPAADLPGNLEPSKTQGSAQAYGITKIRVRCSTRSSATAGNGPLPAAMSLIELDRSPICKTKACPCRISQSRVVLCPSVRIDDLALRIVPSCCCCLV
jgi:hypothetical protein